MYVVAHAVLGTNSLKPWEIFPSRIKSLRRFTATS